MKILILLIFILCISLSLSRGHSGGHSKGSKSQTKSPKKSTTNIYYGNTYYGDHQKSPYEQEKDALTEALYCNDDDMKVGDNCYCGTIELSCCASKDKCTGTLTRSCSQTVDDSKCKNQVIKGIAYWEEMKVIREKMECSNEHYDKNQPCLCGKISASCCKSKSHCEVGMFSDTCDSELDDKKCSDIKLSLTNLTKPTYYKEYVQLFSSSEKMHMLSVVIINMIIFIIL